MKLKQLPSSLYKSIRLRLSDAKGTASTSKKANAVVSLTSIPSRFNILDLTLKSVLTQTLCPKAIYLWINVNDWDSIPKKVLDLEGDILKIKKTKLKTAHKKLIHTLLEEKETPIITCDDDVIYHKNWLKSLYETHLKHPDYVIGHRLRTIQFDKNGNALPYDSWKYNQKAPLENQMTIGVNGVLYPPKIFSEAIHDERLFMKLAPKNDDLWFKAIELVEGIKIRKSDQTPPPPIPIPGTQKISLKKENVDQKMNDSQWSELTEYYNLNKYLKR